MTESTNQLLHQLKSRNKHHRMDAARQLADLGDLSLGDALARALEQEKNTQIRVELGVALGLMGDKRGLPGLITGITKERPTDLTAIALLARLGDSTCIEPLKRAAKRFFLHPLVKVRLTATTATLEQSPATRDQLVALSRHPKPEVRNYALELMGEATRPWGEYLTRLEEAASVGGEEPMDGESRLYAIRALRACASSVPEARDILTRVLDKFPLREAESQELASMDGKDPE